MMRAAMAVTSGTARISGCGSYRYLLTREIPQINSAGTAVFVMLNPSTADADQDDPTIRRCIGFAGSWGCNLLIVANLYALRSTDPKALWQHPDPVGPENDAVLAELAREYTDIVCAWGANARPERVLAFASVIRENGGEMWCLGATKAGQPRHPLYLKRDARPVAWTPPR